MPSERVVITGAAGHIGSALREGLRDADRVLRLTDVRELDASADDEDVVQADLSDFEAVLELMKDVHAVVHLGGIPDEDVFARLLEANVVGTYHVFEAARRQGVRRVVFASTNHVTGFYPEAQRIGPDDPVRPDTLYAVSKVFGEALGRMYADKFGLEVVCLRIGSFGKRPGGANSARMWLSPRDAVQLVRRSLEAPDVGFLIVYGASRVPDPFWENPGAARIGFEPEEELHDMPAPEETGEERLQGGRYTRRDYGPQFGAA